MYLSYGPNFTAKHCYEWLQQGRLKLGKQKPSKLPRILFRFYLSVYVEDAQILVAILFTAHQAGRMESSYQKTQE